MSRSASASATVARAKTHEFLHRFRGYWSDGGICRIRVFEAAGLIPVIVCSEREENQNTSVTNLAEYLAAEVIGRLFPARFEDPEPCIWVEHYPGRRDPRRNIIGRAEFDRVTFASWTPRACWLGGVQRTRLGEPEWHRLTPEAVAALIG